MCQKTVTASEIKWLIKENVTTIVDLRQDEERHTVSCPLENDNRFRYFSMPVSGGNESHKGQNKYSLIYKHG